MPVRTSSYEWKTGKRYGAGQIAPSYLSAPPWPRRESELERFSGGPDRTRICDLYRVKVRT
jgi:hypothetical protein